jgi:uncharacterized Fe-S center protein
MHAYAYANAMQLRTKHLRCYKCRAIAHICPSHAVHPCALDAAPLRYPHVQGGSVVPPDC